MDLNRAEVSGVFENRDPGGRLPSSKFLFYRLIVWGHSLHLHKPLLPPLQNGYENRTELLERMHMEYLAPCLAYTEHSTDTDRYPTFWKTSVFKFFFCFLWRYSDFRRKMRYEGRVLTCNGHLSSFHPHNHPMRQCYFPYSKNEAGSLNEVECSVQGHIRGRAGLHIQIGPILLVFPLPLRDTLPSLPHQ